MADMFLRKFHLEGLLTTLLACTIPQGPRLHSFPLQKLQQYKCTWAFNQMQSLGVDFCYAPVTSLMDAYSFSQELMSHPKGGEGAFNYIVTALSKVLAVL